jgi:DNA polymerase IV
VFVSTTILHADLDAFFASVEQRDDPRLQGRPVIVGGGVVLAASYEARARGVRSAMGGAQARRLCPDAVVVRPRFSAYVEASRAVHVVFEQTTPVVEALSIDEAFLDVRGLERIAGTPVEIAARLRREVRQRVGLPITVGVARTRFLAKVASGVAKPDGLLLVPPEREAAFLDPLPVGMLWGVGPRTAARLRDRGILTAGQAAAVDEATLVRLLGRGTGRHVHALVHRRDRRPPRGRGHRRGRRSMGAQSALGRTRPSPEAARVVLVRLVDKLARRLRSAGLACRTVVLRLRFDDFTRATRSHTLSLATAQTQTILAVACELLADARPTIERRGLTLVGVTLTNLGDEVTGQLALPFDDRARALDAALDDVRERFGSAAITRAVLVGRRR